MMIGYTVAYRQQRHETTLNYNSNHRLDDPRYLCLGMLERNYTVSECFSSKVKFLRTCKLLRLTFFDGQLANF